MKRRALTAAVSLSITLVVLASNISAALAAQPWSLHIEVPELIGQSGEPFTATGSAVHEGVVCPSGMVDELSTVASGATSGPSQFCTFSNGLTARMRVEASPVGAARQRHA